MEHQLINWFIAIGSGGVCISIARTAIQIFHNDREINARSPSPGAELEEQKRPNIRIQMGLVVHFLFAASLFLAFIAVAHAWSAVTGIRLNHHTWAGPLFLKILFGLGAYLFLSAAPLMISLKRTQRQSMAALSDTLETARTRLEAERGTMTGEQYALSLQLLDRLEQRSAAFKAGKTPKAEDMMAETLGDIHLQRQIIQAGREKMSEEQYEQALRHLDEQEKLLTQSSTTADSPRPRWLPRL